MFEVWVLRLCHVLRTGVYIASSPPLGHHHSYIYLHKHTFPLPQLVQAVTPPTHTTQPPSAHVLSLPLSEHQQFENSSKA
jgi:hypothetical protein